MFKDQDCQNKLMQQLTITFQDYGEGMMILANEKHNY
jgi:hypothetical protein